MIAPLRRWHRWMVASVVVVVVPLFFAAIGVRPDRALEENLDGRFERRSSETSGGVEAQLPTDPPMAVRISAGGATVTVATPLDIPAGASSVAPALLLYWQPDESAFPEDAILLGTISGRGRTSLLLEEAVASAVGPAGDLVLYSLGHGEEIARTGWPQGATR